jgi:hypothetical protein
MPGLRRFPPPCTAEETEACFIVRDRNGQALAYVYFEEEPGRRAAARIGSRPAAIEEGRARLAARSSRRR